MGEAAGGTHANARLFAAVLLVAAVLAAPLATSNENRTLALLRAFEHGRLTIDPDAGTTGDRAWVPRRASAASVSVGDAIPALAAGGGHFYAGVAPGLAVSLYPAYRLARAASLPPWAIELVLVLVGASLPLALGSLGVKRAVESTLDANAPREDDGMVAGATFGLATIALAYGTRLWAHALVVSLVAWSLALLLDASDERPGAQASGRRWLAGLLAGAAVACDYNVGLVAASLGVIALWRGGLRGGLSFALGALGPAVALGTYHAACFGSPFRTPYEFHTARDVRAVIAEGRFGFTAPRPLALLELLVGPRRGILWSEPALLVGIAGLAALARRGRTHAFALGVVALTLLQNAARARDWHGGTCFGPRYTIALVPFALLGLPRGRALAGRLGPWVLGASGALALLGTATSFTFSVPLALEHLWRLGPRTIGLAQLVLGPGDHESGGGNALVAAVALSVALPVAWALLRGTSSRVALVGLVLAPWLVTAPFLKLVGREGPDGYRRVERELFHEELKLECAAAWHPAEVGHYLGWAIQRGDREGAVIALERLVEMEPEDEGLREMLKLNRQNR